MISDGVKAEDADEIIEKHKKLSDKQKLATIHRDLYKFYSSTDHVIVKEILDKYYDENGPEKPYESELKNQVVANGDGYTVYKILNPYQSLLFLGKTDWDIANYPKRDAKEKFAAYTRGGKNPFYFFVKDSPTGGKWDFIALHMTQDGDEYWDKNDNVYDLEVPVKLPNFKRSELKTFDFEALKNKIVGENDEYIAYRIETPEEAWMFNGKAEWDICEDDKDMSKLQFGAYLMDATNIHIFVRKNLKNDKSDFIIWYKNNDTLDEYHDALDKELGGKVKSNLPTFSLPKLKKLEKHPYVKSTEMD